MSLTKISEGSHSTVYVSDNGLTVNKIIHGDATREIGFLNKIVSRQCRNVLLPISIDITNSTVVFPKLSPLPLLPFALLDYNNKVRIIRQIINGLNEIHSINIIHNDLKLDNILYDPNTLTVKIIDFSTSLFFNEKLCISGGTTPLYECPESQRTYKSDIWSLGICILKLIEIPDDIVKKLKYMNKSTINFIVRQHAKCKNNIVFARIALLCLHPDPNKRYFIG